MATRPRGWGGDSCDALAPASLARICKPAKESPIAAPLLQANISGKDIPDAAARASQESRHPSAARYTPITCPSPSNKQNSQLRIDSRCVILSNSVHMRIYYL